MKRQGEHGFALLVVLWTLALLALVGSHVTAAARGALARSAALRAAAEAEATADGLVTQAIFHLLDGSPRGWPADGVPRPVRLARGAGVLTIEDAAGRINPGIASPVVLAALLRRLGVAPGGAQRLAAALVDWHTAGDAASPDGAKAAQYRAAGLPWSPANERIAATGELALVLGMTPDLLARLAPYIDVYTDGAVDIAKASPLVAGVLQEAGAAPAPPAENAPLVVEITARVTLPDARATRHAVVRIDPNGDAPRPYRVLEWH